jgi:RNA polymerase sigma factor (sigma-70 family)
MAVRGRDSCARQLRTLFNLGTAGQLTDAQLLERFAARHGESAEMAFAALVERHGPMVLRVCRQTLRSGHDAEDAFQAAFLVLARRARSLRVQNSLAPWLHQVAWRTASCLRADAARRIRHERKASERSAEVMVDRDRDDSGEILHEELGRLPANYRLPLVLCYLEGLTSEQVAEQLGWRSGTVRSRLARGRAQLRERLIRRGLAPSAAALAASLAPRSAWAAVPPILAEKTARAATFVVIGRVTAGAVPASILTLTEGVLQAMILTKCKIAGVILLLTGILTSGVIVSAQVPDQGSRQPDQLKALELKLDQALRTLKLDPSLLPPSVDVKLDHVLHALERDAKDKPLDGPQRPPIEVAAAPAMPQDSSKPVPEANDVAAAARFGARPDPLVDAGNPPPKRSPLGERTTAQVGQTGRVIEIKAPLDGQIIHVRVRPGQLVQRDELLVELEIDGQAQATGKPVPYAPSSGANPSTSGWWKRNGQPGAASTGSTSAASDASKRNGKPGSASTGSNPAAFNAFDPKNEPPTQSNPLSDHERRLQDVEKKLDQILKALDRSGRTSDQNVPPRPH